MRRWVTVLCVCACALPTGAQAPDPFASVTDADPMELARAVDRHGDFSVVARLGADRSLAVRLAAVRAVPFMDGPEVALAPLVELAAGRDAWLAPAAGQSLLDLTASLSASGLGRREADLAAILEAARALDDLAADESARADLRVAAELAAQRLRSVAGQAPAGAPATE